MTIGSYSLGSAGRECVLELLPPRSTREHRMLHLFSPIYGQDRQLLSEAYVAAYDELQDGYHLSGTELGTLVGPLVNALVSLYSAGEQDQTILTQYAVSRVLGPTVRTTSARVEKRSERYKASLQ
jgi:hypothetical protein